MANYIYGLVCPIAGVVRYVGKSTRPQARLRAHIHGAVREAYDHHTSRWLRKLKAADLEPTLIILHEVAEGERWQDAERAFIASAPDRGWKLTNSTAGGEGLDYIDPEADARYRANLSAAMTKVWGTPERRLVAQARSRKFYSDPVASAAKAAAVRKAYERPEVLARASEINREIGSRPEVKAAKSQKAKAAWSDPITGSKRRATFKADATRAKMSASAKARFAEPGAKAYLSTPEQRAKLSAAAQRRSTPEYRAMMAAKTAASWKKRKGLSP